MRRKLFLSVSVFFLMVTFVFAQSSDTPVMSYWSGGNLNLDFQMYLNSTGFSPNGGTFGGTLSPALGPGCFSVFGNPAELGKMKKSEFLFDAAFGISTNTFGISNGDLISEKDIASSTDDFLKDTTTFIFDNNSFKSYTQVNNLNVTLRKSGFGTFATAFPLSSMFTVGFGYSRPFAFGLNLAVPNIRTALRTTKAVGNNETSIDVILNTDVNSKLNLSMSMLSFSLGTNFSAVKGEDNFYAGITLNKYSAFFRSYFNLYSNGMMVLNDNNEYYFNDPEDKNLDRTKGETNSLFWLANGNYSCSRWGVKLGFLLEPQASIPFMNFSVVLDVVPSFVLTDPNAKSESYQPKFLVGRFSGTDDDALDILIDSLSLAKPNLTVPTHNVFTDSVFLNLPSSLNIGMDFKLGDHTFAFNFVKYFNEFSYRFGRYKIGKKVSSGIKLGMDFKLPAVYKDWDWALIPVRLLYLDFDGLLFQLFGEETNYSNPHFRIGGGLMFGNAIVEGVEDKDQRKAFEDLLGMPLPTGLALGREYTVFNRLTVSTVVYGYPDFLMKYSFRLRI